MDQPRKTINIYASRELKENCNLKELLAAVESFREEIVDKYRIDPADDEIGFEVDSDYDYLDEENNLYVKMIFNKSFENPNYAEELDLYNRWLANRRAFEEEQRRLELELIQKRRQDRLELVMKQNQQINDLDLSDAKKNRIYRKLLKHMG